MKCSKCGWIVCAASLCWVELNASFGEVVGGLARGFLGMLGEVLSHAFIDPWAGKKYPVCGRCAAELRTEKGSGDLRDLRENILRELQRN